MTTCLTCSHWNPKASGDMAKQGFSNCDKGKPYVYYPPQHSCRRHEEAPKPIQAARVKFFERKKRNQNESS